MPSVDHEKPPLVAEEVGSAATRREPPFLRGLTFVGAGQATWLVRRPMTRTSCGRRHRSCGTAPDSYRLRCICTGRGYVPGPATIPHTAPVLGAILTIGNEVVSGDVQNTNATWLAQRLESLGVRVVLSAAVPDETDAIVEFI